MAFATLTPDEERNNNLVFVAIAAAGPARQALSASFIMHAADAFFQHEQARFNTNVGNTLAYAAMNALEAQALVDLAEVVRNEKDNEEKKKTGDGERFPLPITIRGRNRLLNHRDMICHPMVVYWKSEANRDFAKAKHKWSDVRAGIVWDVLKQINEALRAMGAEVYVPEVPVGLEMAEALQTILKSATREGAPIRGADELHAFLQRQRAKFVQILERHP
ncbi:MAG: hypothetical protein ABIQ16_05275, partial [Polyangiaceae bacterium]